MNAVTISIPDPRPLYPEQIACGAPLGTRDRVRRAAQQAGTTAAGFIRSAIEDRLRQATAPGASAAS